MRLKPAPTPRGQMPTAVRSYRVQLWRCSGRTRDAMTGRRQCRTCGEASAQPAAAGGQEGRQAAPTAPRQTWCDLAAPVAMYEPERAVCRAQGAVTGLPTNWGVRLKPAPTLRRRTRTRKGGRAHARASRSGARTVNKSSCQPHVEQRRCDWRQQPRQRPAHTGGQRPGEAAEGAQEARRTEGLDYAQGGEGGLIVVDGQYHVVVSKVDDAEAGEAF